MNLAKPARETTLVERFFITKPTPGTKPCADKDGHGQYHGNNGLLLWSAPFPLPNMGDRIRIIMNSIGPAIVKGYFESSGFLGVMTKAEKPPKWLRNQHKRDLKSERDMPQWMKDGIGCEFGAEIELIRTERPLTIKRQRLGQLSVLNSKKLPSVINDRGKRFHWVGIGWVDEGRATGLEIKVVD